MKRKFFRGLTLLEILIAISLIGILIFSSVIFVPTQIKKAKDAKIKAHLHQIKMGLEDYYDSNSEYPKTLPDCNQSLVKDGKFYIPNIPCNPYDGSSYVYRRNQGESEDWFKLYALLGNENDSNISLVGCDGGCGPDCQYNYGVSSINVLITRCSYVCAPGGGRTGVCERYENPDISFCPVLYGKDSTCKNECAL